MEHRTYWREWPLREHTHGGYLVESYQSALARTVGARLVTLNGRVGQPLEPVSAIDSMICFWNTAKMVRTGINAITEAVIMSG